MDTNSPLENLTSLYGTELHCALLNPVSLEKSECCFGGGTPPYEPTEAESQPPSWVRLSLHHADNHTNNPPVDYRPRGCSMARQHRVMSYWFWHCLTAATMPLLMSLVPSAHNPSYQRVPSLSITKASQVTILDLTTDPPYRPTGKSPWYFPVVVLFLGLEAFGL